MSEQPWWAGKVVELGDPVEPLEEGALPGHGVHVWEPHEGDGRRKGHGNAIEVWAATAEEAKARAEAIVSATHVAWPGSADYVCGACGSLEIEVTAWVNANTNETDGGEPYNDDAWCPECDEHTRCVLAEDYEKEVDDGER